MPAKKAKPRTVNDLLDRFEKEVVPGLKPRTRASYARHIAMIRTHFGTRIADQLVLADFSNFMNVSAGKFHRNKIISTLSSVFSRAVQDWHWLDHNVCAYVPRHKSIPQQRNVTDETIEALRSIANNSMRNAVDLALMTGQIQSAIIGLKWSQITPRVIRFRKPNTGKSIQVAITPEIQSVLERCKQRSGKSRYVIATRTGDGFTNEGFRAQWQWTMRKLEETGHNRFTFHDIRVRAEELKAAEEFGRSGATSAAALYPQFEQILRDEAAQMSKYYELFYCLEQSIRKFVISVMEDAYGDKWWSTPQVPPDIVDYAAKLIASERDNGITPRSTSPIDYTSFGQLSGIIVANWTKFEPSLTGTTKGAVLKVMSSLNLLRGPIAHCSPMSKDEMARLHVFIRDWLRMVA